MRALLIVPLMLLLAACQTASTYPTTGDLPARTKVDVQIAKASTEVAKHCALVGMAIVTAQAFATDEKVLKALGAAEAARAQFCLAPPSDVNTAIATLSSMAIAVNNAVRSAPAPTLDHTGGA